MCATGRASAPSSASYTTPSQPGLFTPEQRFPELGQIIAGAVQGRVSEEQITVCDLTGTGVQDTAIATFARGRAAGVGTTITS